MQLQMQLQLQPERAGNAKQRAAHESRGWLRIGLPNTANSPQFLNSIEADF
jgi:hypothetical protein